MATRIAVLGAGHVGPVIARLALRADYSVAIANSRDPADLELIAQLVIPGAEPRWAADAVADADLVVLAIPLKRFLAIDAGSCSGKLVIDTMNYWPSSDGVVEPFERGGVGSSEIVAQRLPGSTVVKTLNHIGYHDLEDHAQPVGSADRRAVGVAGDDAAGVAAASQFVDRLGYDPVVIGGLMDGRILQPGGPVFGVVLRREDFGRAVRLLEAS
jgi:predicted dinucleotide-binding enzyme